jgi:N-methylhydantoinase A
MSALRFEVRERITAEGEVLVPLDEALVERVCDRLEALGVEAVAILLLHCYVDPAHEKRVKEIVERRLPGVFVSASHELSEEYREFERCSTVVSNAYIGPRVRGYVQGIDRHLDRSSFRGKFLLVQSTGGLYEAREAQTQCVRMLESGPAAGVIGARALCRCLGLSGGSTWADHGEGRRDPPRRR